MFPSGSFWICRIWATTPISNRSAWVGALVSPLRWVTMNRRRSPVMARSIARSVLGRPANSGMVISGSSTMSRMGITGASTAGAGPAGGAGEAAGWLASTSMAADRVCQFLQPRVWAISSRLSE